MKRVLPLFITALLVTCHKPTQQELLNRIAEAEKVLEDDMEPVPAHAIDAAESYLDYIRAFRDDTARVPHFWLKVAELYNASGNPDTALTFTDSLMKNYSGHELIPRALLFRGAVYEYGLSRLDLARKEYERITTDFNAPAHFEEVTAALSALEWLGKSGEQIMAEWDTIPSPNNE